MKKSDHGAPGRDVAGAFRVHEVPAPADLFSVLSASAPFEDAAKGRRGAVLVVADDPRGIPLVRTTTRYTRPAHPFEEVHGWLARQIGEIASLSTRFNNALIETYSSACTTMGAHSDQALDLEDGTEIAIFSCYERPEERPSRKLVVEPKKGGSPSFAVSFAHHSVVIFSAETNRTFRHRIVLDAARSEPENPWIAVTFRASKTFVQFRDGQPYLEGGAPLTLASPGEQGEFLRLRSRENREVAFVYPRITCTLSPGDLVLPE